ncbi:zinc metallopeptidase [Luteolibacter pohnpeiensis]|uniref:Zinc metallopeptidase n=1 Tax=Luteolibacter pohnpeiensis TaxID=454153 RepID=A0A934S2D4_9BACT|nr:zinc metallopeptidase [Luteolibacter pohnpeiensis]MBK1881920.1 zinc metallopeptidase [Luteolibacter pohnpeiensis]
MTSEIFLLAVQQASPLMGISWIYWVIIGGSLLASMLISSTLKSRFQEYSQIPLRVTGAQVAEAMLRQNGITDVRVVSIPGQLTDHYDPTKKTVNLSEGVYGSNSVAAAAVAAHECGHAVQHQQAYVWLGMRSKMVPAVQFSSSILNYLMIFSLIGAVTLGPATIWIWVTLFVVTTAFSIVTLPVEFDASKRALVWLESSGLAASMEHDKAKNALFWAAMTYVAAAVGSIAQLAYFLMMALGGRRD